MPSLKAKKSHTVKQLLTILSIGLLFATSCSQTKGSLYVSHPQIHTRERLVDQRQREQQWIEKQLGETDKIQTTYQGLRDFREFVGFYNELAVSLNPAQGKLDKLTNDTRASELNAQLWKQRTAELDAYRSYLAALKAGAPSTSGSTSTTTDTSKTGAGQDAGKTPTAESTTSAPPSVSTPFGTEPGKLTLPSPAELVQTKAQAHPLDLFYDRLAYRNAVNAALKSNQLDDSHDFAGEMLYELTLSVSLTPGNRSQQFAQVELELLPETLKDRALSLPLLFDNWVDNLRANLIGDISELQHHVTARKLTEYEKKYLRWFVERFGPSLVSSMEEMFNEMSYYHEQKKTVAVDNILSKLAPRTQLELLAKTVLETTDKIKETKDSYPFGKEDIENLKALLKELCDAKLGDILSSYSDDKKVDDKDKKVKVLLRKIAGWAVWGTHLTQLERIVGITAPKFDEQGYIKLIDSFNVTKRDAYYDYDMQSTDTEESDLMTILKDKFVSPMPPIHKHRGLTDTGLATFVKRVYRAEREMYAATVQPKEHAQNISEASARETMLNLVLALSAMLPNSGVSAGNKSQYARRAQTYLHAITRQPLLVGYGNGEQRFGWFLGPAFKVENGKADFIHRVTRHDVSAGIVIPAWRNRLKLSGKQLWVDKNGQPTDEKALWDGKPILLNMRIPADAGKHITHALLAHSLSEVPSLYTARPYPVIECPDLSREDKVIRVQSVRPTEKDILPQWVLVLGRDLWRSPQVFLDSIKADSVEVLSNMEGVLAKFDRIPYPDTLTGPTAQRPVPVDLTVITSFGRDRCESAVKILPPINLPAAEPEPATLYRPYVDDVEKALGFRFDRPATYGGIKLFVKPADDALSQFSVKEVQAKWTDDNKTVYFELGPSDPKQVSRLWLADLRIYPRPDTDSGVKSLTKKGGQEFAWFANKSERYPKLAINSIEYDTGGKAKSGFELTFDKDRLKAVYMAYPGLSDTVLGSKAKVRLSLGDAQVDVDLSSPDLSKPEKLSVAKEKLDPLSQKLLSSNLKGKDLNVELVYTHSPDGKTVTIPVVASDGTPAKLKFTQEAKPPDVKPPEAKPPEAKSSEVKPSEVKKPEGKKLEGKKPEVNKPEAKKP